MMRVIDNGINMFQFRYVDADKIPRIWRLNPNWTFIIIGAVILVAVVLDQVVHIVQAKAPHPHGRRARAARERDAAEPTTPAGPTTPPKESPTADTS